MKLGIYAICKNEAGHVERFLAALQPELKPGDTITIVDTGSTDGTIARFRERGVWPHEVAISPWRFDTARNAALALVPSGVDAAWALDLDEYPDAGWRAALEEAWTPNLTRLRYRFVWNTLEDGREGVVFHADKLHARHGFRWRGVAHEWLEVDAAEVHAFAAGVVVRHYQDQSINRLERDMLLMARAIADEPDDPRMQHYYARQLFFSGRMVEASEAFQVHLRNPAATWRAERAESMLYLARVGGNEAWREQWLYRAAAEAPERREVWAALAWFHAERGEGALAAAFAARAEALRDEELYVTDVAGTDALLARVREVLEGGA